MTKRGKQTEGKEPETSAEGVNDNLEPDLEAPEPDIDVANVCNNHEKSRLFVRSQPTKIVPRSS